MGIIERTLSASPSMDFTFPTLSQPFDSNTGFQALIGAVMVWVFVVAGIVAFFYLVYSGFVYLTAGGNPDAAKKGQQGIINAIIGLVIIFLAYAIVVAVMNLLGGKN